MVGLSPAEFAAGCPAGHDATPALVDMANRLDRVRPGTDMFRFTDPGTEAEQWIGRDTPFDPWQTWDDPRRYYPGDPADVLDERMVDLTPPLPFDSHSVEVEAELEGAGSTSRTAEGGPDRRRVVLSASSRRSTRISSISSRITLARIVFSPPKPSASYSESSRSSVSPDTLATTTNICSTPVTVNGGPFDPPAM